MAAEMRTIKVGNFEISNKSPFFLMAGPCQMETREHSLMMATEIKKITDKLGINYVFKASFDKANRTSIGAQRGLGLDASMPVFDEIRKDLGIPCITDIHVPEQAAIVAPHMDILQVPAFLCRQTDLLKAIAEQGKPVHVKKLQHLAPWVMQSVVDKFDTFGNSQVMLCDRGTAFGYGTQINDMTGLVTMAQTGCPVTIDATHSVQQPGAIAGKTGGNREMAPVIANAAVAVGVAGVFLEVHQDPDNAPSDGPNMIRLDNLEKVLTKLVKFDKIAKEE